MNCFYKHLLLSSKGALCLALLMLTTHIHAHNPLVKQVVQGSVIGVKEGNSILYKGIPYATPPVAEKRWMPPELPAKFVEQFEADQFGPACPQNNANLLQSENCLSLNIFVPEKHPELNSKPLPVLVWIHGGGFVAGSGNIRTGAHKNWNDNEIILVTFNYRLGALGIFAPTQLEVPHGNNFSVMDMIAALQWVKTNISMFGGDPEKVTIAGGSAGGMAVQMLMINPHSKGLFHGAIAQSGYAAWSLPRTKTVTELRTSPNAHSVSDEIAAKALKVKVNNITKKMLYGASADEFVKAIEGFHLPIVDGKTLPEEPAVMFVQGMQHDVPYISGGNSYEGSVYPYAGVTPEHLFALMGAQKARIKQLYNLQTPSINALPFQHLFGDMRYLLAAKLTSESMATVGQPGYRYFFDYVREPQKYPHGANHGSEAYFLFRQDDDPVLNKMRQYWYNFVRVQNPNGINLRPWPALSEENGSWLTVSDDIAIEGDIRAEKLAQLQAVFKQRTQELMRLH